MPFVSKSQRRWMYANDPEMADRWSKDTPKGKKLPEKLKKKKQLGGMEILESRVDPLTWQVPDFNLQQRPTNAIPIEYQHAKNVDDIMPIKRKGFNKDGSPNWINANNPEKKLDPYFMLRGATTGLSWLSGMVERNRQDQYRMQQEYDMNRRDPLPAEMFQPTPMNLYAQKGGRTPIIVDNPKDKRLQRYNDSLILYNTTVGTDKTLSNTRDFEEWKRFTNNWAKKYEKANVPAYRRLNYPDPAITTQKSFINSENLSETGTAIVFKKPVQPVILRKENPRPKIINGKLATHPRPDLSIGQVNPTLPPEMQLPQYQMRGNIPVRGPGQSLIGMMDGQDFNPDYNNIAGRAGVNQGDTDIVNDDIKLQQYLQSKGVNRQIKKKQKGGMIKFLGGK